MGLPGVKKEEISKISGHRFGLLELSTGLIFFQKNILMKFWSLQRRLDMKIKIH